MLLLALLPPPPTVERLPSMASLTPTEAILDEGSIAPGGELLAMLSQGFIGFFQPDTLATPPDQDTTAAPSSCGKMFDEGRTSER